ncbi:restriction endonuclease subunit S [Latilactobacillus curvatus]|uniref:restriction endonuclease subunit S n=1 Tax=Latilactobacillus curvatus TaxID=28038 RepID=UPI00241174E0|nr:restriction endonuclease subunit S [Latilactobacillus curvatus]MDG2979774.1 restriction endonuclease subunit S [Latilactobacillus curvatus]
MKAQKKQPELRFKGFTDDWEQSKLKDMAESLNYGLNVEAREYDGRNKYIRITDINDVSRKFTPDPITSPNLDNSELNDDYKLQLGDVLFARTGASVGKTYHYESSDGNLYYAGFLIRARIKTAFSSMFLYQFTWGQQYKRFVNVTSQRSGQPGINAKEYGNLTLLLPNYKEQQKIGEFFQKLDHTITLQQRKHELLKKLKQGYLQQMFPAKKQVIPLLRFNEFNETWKLEKLGDITKSFSGGTPTAGTKKYYNGKIPFIRSAEINKRKTELFLTEKGVANSSAKLVSKGTILYALYGATSGEVGVSQIDGAINQAILAIIPNDEYSTLFIVQWLRNNKKKITDKYLQGGQGNLSGTIIKDLQIKFPSSKEQKLVGEFFMKLDQNITLQQLKIKQLQRLKQAYLQKIFP